jgi:hypothetical protein
VSRDAFAGSTASPLSLNRTSYAGNNPVNVVDPSGFVNAVNRDSYDSGSTDNPCLSTAGGLFNGYLVTIACLNLPLGSTQYALIWTPFGPQVLSFTAFAWVPNGDDGGDSGGAQNRKRTPNYHQNKEFDDAVQAIRRIIGRILSDDEVREFHLRVSRQGYHYHEMIEEGLGMFTKK